MDKDFLNYLEKTGSKKELVEFDYNNHKIKFEFDNSKLTTKYRLYLDDQLAKVKIPKFKTREKSKMKIGVDGKKTIFTFIPIKKTNKWEYEIEEKEQEMETRLIVPPKKWMYIFMIPLLPLFLGGAVGAGLFCGGLVLINRFSTFENTKLSMKIISLVIYSIFAWMIYLTIAFILTKFFLW
ncbi:MAG: hypothetical protein JXA99_13625 [Candidatus Lokiarchaeota archaeon]|nr:hypothetical protein [Candidatus Lokiarchaeota archaeon]